MQNFSRFLQLALRNRLTVVGVFVTSLLVAVLWGANIGTVYPVVEVVFKDKSMHDWARESIKKSTDSCRQLQIKVAHINDQLHSVSSNSERDQLERRLSITEHELKTEQRALAAVTRLKPWIETYLPDDAFQTLILIVIFLLLGTLLKDAFLILNMLLAERLSQSTCLVLRQQFFDHMLHTELGVFGQSRTSDLMSRMTGDIRAIGATVTYVFGKSTREPMKMIACFAGAACISWRLLLFSLLVTPLAVFLMYYLAKSIKRANRRLMEEMSRLFERLSQSFAGIKVVKAYTMEEFESKRFCHTARQVYRKMMQITFYQSLTRLNNELLGIAVICFAILAGGYLVINHETHLFGIRMANRPLSFGSVMLFFAFLAGVSDPARKLADLVNVVQRGTAAADRIYPFLDRRPVIQDPLQPARLDDPARDIVFNRVHFHYTKDQPVLKDINLRIAFGETVAIVGPNGCGKSTLVNLIPRFYDPISGEVRLGETNLQALAQRDLRNQIGIVTQQPVLFDDTVLNNIRYGSPGATDAEATAAAKQALAHNFIAEKLQDGYDTRIGEGGGQLSGGQRQRIALARAMLRDPAILILDEATSQIDPESERLIHRALEKFVQNRTAIMITHRFSTLELAERVVVMDAGRIIDSGTHEELVGRCGLYQRLYQLSFRQSA